MLNKNKVLPLWPSPPSLPLQVVVRLLSALLPVAWPFGTAALPHAASPSLSRGSQQPISTCWSGRESLARKYVGQDIGTEMKAICLRTHRIGRKNSSVSAEPPAAGEQLSVVSYSTAVVFLLPSQNLWLWHSTNTWGTCWCTKTGGTTEVLKK